MVFIKARKSSFPWGEGTRSLGSFLEWGQNQRETNSIRPYYFHPFFHFRGSKTQYLSNYLDLANAKVLKDLFF